MIEYGDNVIVKRGFFKGKFGKVKQIMANGDIRVMLNNGKYVHFGEPFLSKSEKLYKKFLKRSKR